MPPLTTGRQPAGKGTRHHRDNGLESLQPLGPQAPAGRIPFCGPQVGGVIGSHLGEVQVGNCAAATVGAPRQRGQKHRRNQRRTPGEDAVDDCPSLPWGGVYQECGAPQPFAPGSGGEEVRPVRRNLPLGKSVIKELDDLQVGFRRGFGPAEALKLAIAIDAVAHVTNELRGAWGSLIFYRRAMSAYKGFLSGGVLGADEFGRHLESHGPWRPGPLEWSMFAYWHCVVDLWCRVPRYPRAEPFRHGEENMYVRPTAKTIVPSVKKDISRRMAAANPPKVQMSVYHDALESIRTAESS